MLDPLETSELLAFTKTVDSKSLSHAAEELGVPRATIGRRLARLEQRLGVRLLRRTTRSITLTDAGEVLYRHARIALEAVNQAEASVRRTDGAIRGDLRVSFPPTDDPELTRMIAEFVTLHPDVRMNAHFTTEHVDLLRGGYDVALRASSELEPGLVARTLARVRLWAVASPRYLAEHGTPRTPRDLRKHRCILGFSRGQLPQTHWPLVDGGRISLDGVFCSNDLSIQRDLALRGLGIALLPSVTIYSHVEAGELVRVLEDSVGTDVRLALVYPEREFLPPQVRAFIDTFAKWLPDKLRRRDDRLRPEIEERPDGGPRSTSLEPKPKPRPSAKAARRPSQKRPRAQPKR